MKSHFRTLFVQISNPQRLDQTRSLWFFFVKTNFDKRVPDVVAGQFEHFNVNHKSQLSSIIVWFWFHRQILFITLLISLAKSVLSAWWPCTSYSQYSSNYYEWFIRNEGPIKSEQNRFDFTFFHFGNSFNYILSYGGRDLVLRPVRSLFRRFCDSFFVNRTKKMYLPKRIE